MTVEELEAEILKLPEADQLQLVGRINESLNPVDPSVQEVWGLEIERRVRDIQAGRFNCRDSEEVEAEIEVELNARR